MKTEAEEGNPASLLEKRQHQDTPPIDDIIVGVENVLKLVPYEERSSNVPKCKQEAYVTSGP
jgi:hypothetical protein